MQKDKKYFIEMRYVKMENVIGQGFCELTIDEQSEINGGIIPIVAAAAVVAGTYALGAVQYYITKDLNNVYRNGYNEIRYK